jgi:ABC-type phosphate/phosphonate transport system substrate-binding protein
MIARPTIRRILAAALLAVLGPILAACGGSGTPTSTAVPPTPTATPLSEPLPTVATLPPFGTADRPFRLAIVREEGLRGSASALETFLIGQTGQSFLVDVVDTGADALDILCGDTPAFAWLDGLTMIAARLRGCGDVALQVRRGRGGATATGISADLIASSELSITSVAGFRGRTFCRLGSDDAATWVVPALFMRSSGGFDPLVDLERVREVPDLETLVREVGTAQCVSALPAGALRQIRVPGMLVSEAVSVTATTPEIPFGGLVISSRVPASLAAEVSRLFRENPDALRNLVNASALVEVRAGALNPVETMLRAAGPDFSGYLGSQLSGLRRAGMP